MTNTDLVLIIVGGSLYTSLMIVSAITYVYPKWLKVTAPVICRSGEQMRVWVGHATYHRPSERGLTITCVSSAEIIRAVTLRAFFLAWIVLAIPMLIVGAVSVVIIKAL